MDGRRSDYDIEVAVEEENKKREGGVLRSLVSLSLFFSQASFRVIFRNFVRILRLRSDRVRLRSFRAC